MERGRRCFQFRVVKHLAFDYSGPGEAVSKASAEVGTEVAMEVDKREVIAEEKNPIEPNPEGQKL